MDNQEQNGENKKEEVNSKIQNFQFDQVMKKKAPVVKNTVKENPKPQTQEKQAIEIKKAKEQVKKQRKQIHAFKYGHYTFKRLEDVSAFLLLEYHKKDKHAKKLLEDEAFIEWLRSVVGNKELFNEWVENVL